MIPKNTEIQKQILSGNRKKVKNFITKVSAQTVRGTEKTK
jgi:hypothetical protein